MIEHVFDDTIESRGRYLAEVIYGANDGIVTTFAVVSGVAGAALNPSIVLILGAANLFADGFSMGMSNYLSHRSQLDYEHTVHRQSDDGNRKTPGRTAIVTFLAFVVAGWAPLLPYMVGLDQVFTYSIMFTGVAFFLVGASRSYVTDRHWVLNGGEMFIVGMIAAGVAYAVGSALGGLA